MPAAIIFFLFTSCGGRRQNPEPVDFEHTPILAVDSMHAEQYDRDVITMRMYAPRMERYSFIKDSIRQSYDIYTGGFQVRIYTSDGLLETQLDSDGAKHVTTAGEESWLAFGNVVIQNYIKGEMMETDTIWWDRDRHMIHTDCYIKMTSQSALMQGYGMESDERAENSIILRPFDSFSRVDKDTVNLYLDSVNFVGPMQRF